ncbi:hypothetical protein LCGC14_2869320 [marine sediment metagenome]|uniref:Uncharacterized protein n=1 Tax=marine sediment metagenome TaxID=412755 RepID=A0A0F8YQ66_9ZZZZ
MRPKSWKKMSREQIIHMIKNGLSVGIPVIVDHEINGTESACSIGFYRSYDKKGINLSTIYESPYETDKTKFSFSFEEIFALGAIEVLKETIEAPPQIH